MSFDGKKILVTGGNGMIGRALIRLLKDQTSAQLTVADLPKFDLRNRKDCELICKGQDIIFHLAGIKGSPLRCMKSPASFSVPMIQFNANMIEYAYKSGAEWFLYTSSIGVYHPEEMFLEDNLWKALPSENDWYAGWAKRIGELNVQAYADEYHWYRYSIVRPANVYGPHDNFGQWSMVIPSLIKKAMENDVLEVWGDGTPIRDLIYVDDVARGMIQMVKNKVIEPVNLGSGNGVTIKEVARIIAEYFNIDIKWNKSKPMGDRKRVMNINRAESYGFNPIVTLKDGIIKTIEWYKKNKDVL